MIWRLILAYHALNMCDNCDMHGLYYDGMIIRAVWQLRIPHWPRLTPPSASVHNGPQGG